MEDNLVFGVKIDLQKGVEEALKDGDKALESIEKLFGKHPITIKLRMDNRVARGASAELTGFKQQLAELTQQWNSLTAAERGSAAGAAIREKFRALRTEAQGYTSTLQAAVKAEDKMRESHSKTAASANKLSSAYHNQNTYLSHLIQRMAAYAGVSYVGNFLTNVREVTAQFELQRISLGAIIQDQQRANQLFEEIKTFALKSPVKILDLTKYTKQLAAYKIGVDELFETTKRLTDVSVGLGVSMDRVVLAYGQVRARGALYSSEIRQFTEMGVPIVEELAAKLTKMNGELVTSAQVLDLVQKGAISFEMVKEVFDDMTSAGGIFYNMQEKQGNTLFGMWQKLGDAAAMMYDQIGNISSVNEGMKMAIQSLRYLMLHWKQVGIVVGGVSVYILANTIATKNNAIATAAATTANQAHIASLTAKLNALRLEQLNLKSTHIFQRLYTAATISATKAQIGAATSTNVFSKALYGLKAALLSNPLTALAVALTTIIALLIQSESELDKLNSKLQDIDRDYDASGKKSVDRFKELVKAVEENVDGSKAQKEALDELDRTYGKILGSEALELDSLKAMGGQYGELIEMIEAYNAKKKGEERETAIKSSYATILDEEKDDLMDYLNAAGMSAEQQAEFISRLNERMIEYAGEADAAIKATNETFKEFADDLSAANIWGNAINLLNVGKLIDAWGVSARDFGGWFGGQGMDYLYNYARALEQQNVLLEENEKKTRLEADALGEYSSSIDGLNKSFANLDWSSMEALYNSLQDYNAKHPENMISVPIDLSFDPAKAETEYDKLLETSNMKINAIFSVLQQIATQEGQTIPEEFYKQAKSVVDGNKDFSFIDWAKLEEQFKSSPKALAAIRASKQLYESIAPSDDTVRMFNRKFMMLADNMDVSLDKIQDYLMKSSDNLGEHREKLSDEITRLLKEIARLEWTKKSLTLFGLPAEAVEKKIQESQQTLKLLQSMISTIPDIEAIGKKKKKKGGGGTKSDPRLQNLKEEISLTKKLYDEYHKLEKQIGATQAKSKIQEYYANTIADLEKRAKDKYGFTFALPFTDENLKANIRQYISAMEKLQKEVDKKGRPKFPTIGKEIDEAKAMLGAIDTDGLSKRIEKQLKALADRISRTKTAKEFYEKILGMTGDVELAARVSLALYDTSGRDLQKQIKERLQTLVGNTSVKLPDTLFRSDDTIDTKALRVWAKENEKLLGEAYKELVKIADEADKDLQKTIEGWLKATEKAKTYSDKLLDLARTTALEIARINTEKAHTQADIDKLLGLPDADSPENQAKIEKLRALLGDYDVLIERFKAKQAEEETKLGYEAFKESPMYVQMFDDLDHASTAMLENMKTRIEGLKGAWKDLTPTQLKELQSRMNEIDAQLAKRNPFKTLADSIRKYRDLRKTGDERGNKSEGAAVDDLNAAAERADAARKAYSDMLSKYAKDGETYDEMLDRLQKENADGANEVSKAQKELKDAMSNEEAAQKAVENWKKVKDMIGLSANELFQMLNWAGDIAKGIADISEAMGADEEDVQHWNDVADALGQISGGIQDIVQSAMSGNVVGIISSALTAIPKMFVGFTNLFSAGKIKRANKEIKRQQQLLEQLEYTYGRLEAAADKVFGRDYLNNYQQQMKNLQAQADAYQKQADAERSKGKKKDEEKIKEYENQARETADKIKELQDDLVAHFTGSTKTDVARQMAKSWVDARASMRDTFAAIKGDYADMVKNMLVEGAAARVIENALTPVWDSMQKMLEKNDVNGAIDSLVNGMDSALNAANNGMEVLWKALEARGYDMKQLIGDTDSEYTGIAKSVAGATSEEINNVAAIGNTLMYYVSPIPRIDENLARVVAIMEGRGTSAIHQTASTGWTDWQQQAMDNYQAIARNTAETVVRCERAAIACEKMARVIKTKGATSGFNVFLNS